MKKLLIIPILLLSCAESNVEKKKTQYIIQEGWSGLEVVTVDSCEYLFGPWGNAAVLTHKGNCKFCKNR